MTCMIAGLPLNQRVSRPFYLSLLTTLALVFSTPLMGWSEHALATRPALEALPQISNAPPVPVQTLEDFLSAEAGGLEALLERHEQRMREREHYMPRPDELRFVADGSSATMRDRFLRAIRVNPEIPDLYYIQKLPGDPATNCRPLSYHRVSIYENDHFLAPIRYCALRPGEMVRPIDVVATASDEPDYGMDVGLFADNGTDYGSQYGFGPQPFGNPQYEYSSQAPFHMGFYHEAWIVFQVAGFLRRTLPDYRIDLYLNLSTFAFARGHPYWGYRFLGIGIHYVGDFTQPYHARVLPGIGTTSLLWTNFMDMLGFPKGREEAVQLVSNRHTTLEYYQRALMSVSLKRDGGNHSIFAALRNSDGDPGYGDFDSEYILEMTEESEARADELDDILARYMPDRFVNDPLYQFAPYDESGDVYETMQSRAEAREEFHGILTELFLNYGSHVRNYARAALRFKKPQS